MDINKVQPLLSILIPTKNRILFAKSALTSILGISDSRLELVIQDNSDSNEFKKWITANVNDTRLVYNHTTTPLSFVENFSESIRLASGEYLCIIGDDDGINPEILYAAEWLKRENIDCLSTRITANFVWGDANVPTTIFTNVTGGVLTISKSIEYIREADPQKELESFVKDGAINYLDFNLPKLYHGIVSRTCLEKVKSKTGSYLGGLSPDIFASISIACIANKLYVTNYPLTISGVCGVSASIVEGLLKKNSKKLEDAPHLKNRGNYEWSEIVPRIYCAETIWADSAIAALKSMGRNDLIAKIPYHKLLAHCININPEISNEVLMKLKELSFSKKQNIFSSYFSLLFLRLIFKFKVLIIFLNRVKTRLFIMFGIKHYNRIDKLNNINEASIALTKLLTIGNFKFNYLVKIFYKS